MKRCAVGFGVVVCVGLFYLAVREVPEPRPVIAEGVYLEDLDGAEVGKPVTVTGKVVHAGGNEGGEYVQLLANRHGYYVGVTCWLDSPTTFKKGDWLTVTGTVTDLDARDGGKTLTLKKVEKISPAD